MPIMDTYVKLFRNWSFLEKSGEKFAILLAGKLIGFCSTNGNWRKENLLQTSQFSGWWNMGMRDISDKVDKRYKNEDVQ